jgi:hypothetical protein
MSTPSDEGLGGEGETFDEGEDLRATRRLIASVEELRALLAPLSPEERERVLALAREIAEQPGRPGADQ